MAHRQQQLIDEILGEDAEESDLSLRGKALERATGNKVPTTLTPWEWQEWYAEHGVPAAHRSPASRSKKRAWWRRLLGLS